MLREKVYQMFITGTGPKLDYALSNDLGGVIFFTRDIDTKGGFKSLISVIKSKTSNVQPFLSIDQEGGRVERTENIHPRYDSPNTAFKRGENYLKTQTEMIISELHEYGLNMNFAPCIDVNSNPNNPIIGERAFSDNPDDVCKGFDIVFNEYKKSDIIPVVKHFPGHGDADRDSHKELPEIRLPLNKMEEIHIKPFAHAIESGVDCVMVAHLHCICFENDSVPTSLSKKCIDYLRTKLNFKGVIISDDMFMNGVASYGMKESCIMGIKAGINLFIYRDASDETISLIDDIVELAESDVELRERIEDSYSRIISLKKKYGITK